MGAEFSAGGPFDSSRDRGVSWFSAKAGTRGVLLYEAGLWAPRGGRPWLFALARKRRALYNSILVAGGNHWLLPTSQGTNAKWVTTNGSRIIIHDSLRQTSFMSFHKTF